MKTVYPVDGAYLNDVPAMEQEVSNERAAELIASGAFTDQPPPKSAQPDQTPPDGGVSDSEE